MLCFTALSPHPMAAMPTLEKNQAGQIKKTISALEELSVLMAKTKPQTIIIVSPHGPMRYDRFTINMEEFLSGSFSNFNFTEDEIYDFRNDTELGKKIIDHFRQMNFPVDMIREDSLDYGSLIPIHYLTKNNIKKPKILTLTYTALDWNFHFKFGAEIRKVIDGIDRNIAFIASGDLSHRISQDSPAGYTPYGIKFDKTIMELLRKNDFEKIMRLNPDFCQEVQECGLRSIIIALGLIGSKKNEFIKLAYEHPLGVGYLTGYWRIHR
ncbi:MAG: class III extradiol dioxygenase subunit B-like domain-containing protein [Candidatus Moranbacteria bacterium]|nr:class III extradiol dioxygenase subunit B-like domain-containing protein [Candidatus Moranbacteria bacterium]